jgi:hypothetical protein
MSDDMGQRRSRHSAKISVDQAWEVRFWTDELEVSEAMLRRAILEVGHDADAVRKFLKTGK